MKNLLKSRIVSISKILGGKPIVADTRIAVDFILQLLASGWSYEEIIHDYKLKKEDILAAIDYARETISDVETVSFPSVEVKS